MVRKSSSNSFETTACWWSARSIRWKAGSWIFSMGYRRLDVSMVTIEALNERGVGRLPGLLGIVFTRVDAAEIAAELAVRAELMAPNGFLHAGSIVTLADTTCGYGCFANLPLGATGYTTLELKSNHLGTAMNGTVESGAKSAHRG